MTPTERRYAQIEKEALAVTWACEKFSTYILGKHITIETDQKPLIPLLGKSLDSLPPPPSPPLPPATRPAYAIVHVPGKNLHTADTLSRAPSSSLGHDSVLADLAEQVMVTMVANLPASKERLDVYRKAQQADPVCSLLTSYCKGSKAHQGSEDHQTAGVDAGRVVYAAGRPPYWESDGRIRQHESGGLGRLRDNEESDSPSVQRDGGNTPTKIAGAMRSHTVSGRTD